MPSGLALILPKIKPSLEEGFRPAALANLNYRKQAEIEGIPMVLGLERCDHEISRFECKVFPTGHPREQENFQYVERLVKFLLWQRGAFKLYAGGPLEIGNAVSKLYMQSGERWFDSQFMGDQVYEHPFEVVKCTPEEVPPACETGKVLGRHLDGYRIGFDLGASDRKVSAVVNGSVVFSEEVIWEPRKHSDPGYHYREILAALRTAAGKMAKVDAIGGSSAGIYIDNRPMVASLFRSVPQERFGEVRDLFLRIRKELGVPLEVINDGDVTALAGSMAIGENGVLGIALGSSEASGYVDMDGMIKGWLNELAFAPIDYSPTAPVDEWSGDRGGGALYFSQQCIFRLAPKAGIVIPADLTDADKLKYVQEKLENGHDGAVKIWESMGSFLGYGLAHYADFYDARHVLILGRCTSGSGGDLLLEGAKKVLEVEFPELLEKITLHLPDEKIRRVGQSVAAASLPALNGDNP
jgi:predicted NBD/HSP70 family sugar kinase